MSPVGNISNYQGSAAAIEKIVEGGNVFVKVYNGTGSAISNQAVYALNYQVASGVLTARPLAVATEAVATVVVGVINNAPYGKASIADGEYGWLQIEGYVPRVDTSGTVAANDQLEVLTTAVALIDAGADGGAQLLDEAVGVAIANVTTDVWSVYLFGKQSAIKGS